jgi:predicted nucleotidyltransferase
MWPRRTSPPTLAGRAARRAEILRIAARRGRVFGSVARGEARRGSDVDLLVELAPDRSVLDVSELILDLEETLGCRVDVLAIRQASPAAAQIEREAVPL